MMDIAFELPGFEFSTFAHISSHLTTLELPLYESRVKVVEHGLPEGST